MSVEATKRISELCKDGKGRISNSSPHIKRLTNGLEYYYVEITCDDGSQYGIQVYGEEAVALYNEVTKIQKLGFDGTYFRRDLSPHKT